MNGERRLAKHLRISGTVQGVGYRAAFSSKAQALGLSGWVRNRSDGSVEALICGDEKALAGMIDWAAHGPPGARVKEVAVADAAELRERNRGFEVLPTV
jgi:acylphosphatase